jgi:hypothetical protein
MKHLVLSKVGRLLAVNFLVLCFLLLLVEILFRLFGWGYSSSPVNADPVFHHVHPPNYQYKMYSPSGEFGNFLVYYDSLGRRSQLPSISTNSNNKKKKIVFLGDSFTEALQVPYDTSFIGLFSIKYPGIEFLNYGVGGYSPVLSYLKCKNILRSEKIFPSLVLMTLYSNDVREDSSYISKAVYNSNELVRINGGSKNSLTTNLRKLYIARMIKRISVQRSFETRKSLTLLNGKVVNRLIEENPDIDNTLSEVYILKTDSLLKQYNIPFFITAIPSRYKNFSRDIDDKLFAEKVADWANHHDIRFIDIHNRFNKEYISSNRKFFFEIDVHANAAGHQLIASILEEKLRSYFAQ